MTAVATKCTAILIAPRGPRRAQESKLATTLEVGEVRVSTAAHTITSSSSVLTVALGTLSRTEALQKLRDSRLGQVRSSVKLLSEPEEGRGTACFGPS